MPQPDRIASILRLGSEPGAVVDERPEDTRWVHGFVAGAVLFLVIGTLLGAVIVMSIVNSRLSDMERRLAAPERIIHHGEPVRR